MNTPGAVATEPIPTTVDSRRPSLIGSTHGVGKHGISRLNSRVSDGVKHKTELVEGSLELEDVIEANSEVMCVRYSQDGRLLAAGFADGYVRIYSVSPAKCMFAMLPDELMKLPVTCVRFYPLPVDGDQPEQSHIIAASYASGHVRFWHFSSRKCLMALNDQRVQTMSMAFSTLGNKFVTVGADPKVFVYDVETKQRIAELEATDSRDKMDGHRGRVFAVIYHPREEHVLLTGGWDDTVQYWDDRQKHSVRRIAGPHICGDSIDIDSTRNHIVTGSWRKDNPLQIWDFASAGKIRDVPEDSESTSQLYCAQWLGEERIACGGCFHNMARVIDRGSLITSGKLTQLPQGVFCLDNDRQGLKPRFAVGSASDIYLLKVT